MVSRMLTKQPVLHARHIPTSRGQFDVFEALRQMSEQDSQFVYNASHKQFVKGELPNPRNRAENSRDEQVCDSILKLSPLVQCSCVCCLFFILAVYIPVSLLFMSSAERVEVYVRPYMDQVANRTLSILTNVDRSTVGANDMVQGAVSVSEMAVPAMQAAINQTAQLLTRVEQLAAHPVLQLSVESGTHLAR